MNQFLVKEKKKDIGQLKTEFVLRKNHFVRQKETNLVNTKINFGQMEN